MEKNTFNLKEEVLFGSSNKTISKQLSKLNKLGQIRKIAPRLYTSNLIDTPESIVRKNLFYILSNLYPGAVLSHRSALEYKPTQTGAIFLTYSYTKKIKLLDISIHLQEGFSKIDGDNPLIGDLYVSQRERAYLENLQLSKKLGEDSKTIPLPKLEEKLEEIVRTHGENALNTTREKAKEIAQKLGLNKEFDLLNKLISAILSTHDSSILTPSIATARAKGFPYDANRIALFEDFFITLQQNEFPFIEEKNNTLNSFRNFGFFESYFSNYIEGTIFELEEAKQIVETNTPLLSRNDDSHDILGTYKLTSNKKEMLKTPQSAKELLSILQNRHAILLKSRIDKTPGLFKNKNNFAGQTSFVDYMLVKGTLIKAFDYYKALLSPFSKATFMMFLISEVHPFLDGNGRLARIMMNAELVAVGHSKIIIPTVFREDYILALRKLTRQGDSKPYLKMMRRALEFSASIYEDDFDLMNQQLVESNAFLEPSEGYLNIIKR